MARAITTRVTAAEAPELPLESSNRPLPNPRISRIVARSIIAAIRELVAPITVGS